MPSRHFDLAIAGGTLVTMSSRMDIIENASIGISGGRIALVDTNRTLAADRIIDARGDLILPGLDGVYDDSFFAYFACLAVRREHDGLARCRAVFGDGRR